MTGGMTLGQARALAFIKEFQTANGGASPSFAEIGERLGLASKSGVHRLVHALEDRGVVQILPYRSRSIIIIAQENVSSAHTGVI